LPDGRSLGIVMSDGIGSSYDGETRNENEDYVTLDGKAYKMHVTKLTETNSDDLLSIKHLKSVADNDATCDLLYKPAFEKIA